MIEWRATASFIGTAHRGDRTLGIVITNSIDTVWQVMAIETVRSPSNLETVLSDHGHKVIGAYPDPVSAIEMGKRYAEAWISGDVVDPCDCEDIEAR